MFENEVMRSPISWLEKEKLLYIQALTRNLIDVQNIDWRCFNGVIDGTYSEVGLGVIIGVIVLLGSIIVAAFECEPWDTNCALAIGSLGLGGFIFGVTYDSYFTYDPSLCNINGCIVTPMECVCP